VIIPHTRGYGTTRFLSSETLRNGQPAASALDIIALMDALKVRKAIFGDYDWGGRTADIIAILWPERCKALVSVSGYLIASPEANKLPLPPKRRLAPICRDSLRSRPCTENDRQRGDGGEAGRGVRGRRGRRPTPPSRWNHEFIQLPLVIKEKQNRPTITETEISALLKNVNERYAVLVALVAGTGLRIGEALALRTEDFDPDCQVLHVKRSVWHRCEQNAIRLVDVPESLAQVLCRYIKGRKGHLFTTRAGRLLDSRNVLDVLQRAGRQGGYHAFRRFRFAVLRKAGVPDDLIKLWLGHSQNLIDLYAAQLRYDETYRREWCDRASLGFELGELGYKSEAPIRPSLVA